MVFEEVRNNICTEDETDPSFVFSPPSHILLWIRPKQVAEETLIGYFKWSDNFMNLLEVFQLWREPSMHAHNLLIDYSADWHDIEAIGKGLP